MINEDGCSHCGADLRNGQYSRMVGIVDRDLDCVVAYECPDCKAQEPRKLSEVLAIADPTAFRDPPKKPVR